MLGVKIGADLFPPSQGKQLLRHLFRLNRKGQMTIQPQSGPWAGPPDRKSLGNSGKFPEDFDRSGNPVPVVVLPGVAPEERRRGERGKGGGGGRGERRRE